MLTPSLDMGRDHVFGHRFAQIELVEYGDLQCAKCADVYPEIKMLQEFLGSQLIFSFRHYPLPHLHPMALEAAVACELAAPQDKFWHMHDIIFENQKFLSRAALLRFGDEIEMDMSAYIDSRQYKIAAQRVQDDFNSGVKSGVNGTPTFFINGLRYNGLNDFDSLCKACKYAFLLQEVEWKQPVNN